MGEKRQGCVFLNIVYVYQQRELWIEMLYMIAFGPYCPCSFSRLNAEAHCIGEAC